MDTCRGCPFEACNAMQPFSLLFDWDTLDIKDHSSRLYSSLLNYNDSTILKRSF